MPPSKKGRGKGSITHKKSTQPQHERRSDEKRWSSSSHFTSVAAALLGVVLALGWRNLTSKDDGGGVLSSEDLLAEVRRSSSFELTNSSSRTLLATADIPSGTVLMEIPRELMIWDLDAARDEFVRKELFSTPLLSGDSSDPMSKRAALLSAYLALLRNGAVTANRLQLSVVMAMPSYGEYASFHPVLADLMQVKRYLGEHSPAFQHLLHFRGSLTLEYESLAESSTNFASHVSLKDYLSSRIAVQSRAFEIHNTKSEVSKEERKYYQQNIGIDFGTGVVSIEPVNDWMNSHVNNNVKVGGYDAKKRSGQAWATKAIPKGQELISKYGDFYDYVLFGQYGYLPSDGSGKSIASLSIHHDVNLSGELISGAMSSTSSLPPQMAPYLQYDYGYPECIKKETQPLAFELKQLKLQYLRLIAIDRHWWVLPMPPRSSAETTPISTIALHGYKVPSFGPDIYPYLDANGISVSLPCRLITLTDGDLENGAALLNQDLETLEGSSSTPVLRLEELQVSMPWMIRTIHCMRKLASAQMEKYESSVENQKRYIMTLAESGNINSLEWNAAHMKLSEMQSQAALVNWAQDALESVAEMDPVSSDELFFRDEPCTDLR